MIGRRKRPRRTGDKWAGIRDTPGAIVPSLVRERKRKKDAEPESTLQHLVNQALTRFGVFYFRLSENLLRKATDWTVGGWPDSPIILRLPYGVALLAPLELKREGETMEQKQLDMAHVIGTQLADNWTDAERYIHHARYMQDHISHLLSLYPPDPRYLNYGKSGKDSPLPPR